MSKESYLDFTFLSNVCLIGFYNSTSFYFCDFLAEIKFLKSFAVVTKSSPGLRDVTVVVIGGVF